ncbi:non-ribosomal peptide synthase protein (TIGR01720 family)/amino acid adenylation domain-containing protein [Ancylobacter aquaticus]|uniref:Non-ribosomal peptide synthase protein (TIGR01720 family)/amino acid adenylation domain-containing protein n=1 Tax=Ancylobacter aquaticus TaxID=100 RepID=A0A4R1HSI8_ANCAQ|nr:hybrid non-ribosomal peptide synthetase/type I polyketide synthase [Ancylobacter aquaticus]TCK23540.1 non-ribosomal peptide synthase protein (TIGR01720 family)/amino acid adenylation domain-containing protein [Ancylobacter aquaticus]
MATTEERRAGLLTRLSRLNPEQITDLMLALEGRIDTLRAETARAREPVAIVGLAARFAGTASASAYGRLLFEGRDAVRPAPADRPERVGLPPGGYVDGVERFDADFFGLRPLEADAMDPQHRLALMLAWQALEDAGYADAARRPRATGVFLGLGANEYEARFRATDTLSPAAILGNAGSIAAGRISHWLDVCGPALVIDTACSSSLVAVHAACRALRSDECDLALAGGVNLTLDAELTAALAAAGMLGPGHACRTFDAGADGYVRGEGGGLVVLKRLADARRDGDAIRAIIRGSAINHDGHSSALTAPNGAAQRAVIASALADAGLSAPQVQAVECHGTGTPLGDPIEVQALAAAYGAGRTAPLLLGSAKTNTGHLEAAAGVAGLIKMVLALEAGRLPGTLHQSQPNPRIAWGDLPVRVVDRAMDWPAGDTRRAGVSSFGFSGTNAHLILEEAPPVPEATLEAPLPTILAFSARDAEGLRRMAAGLADHLAAEPGTSLAGIAAALNTGRGRFSHRAACLARSHEEALAGLRAIAEGEAPLAGAAGLAVSGRPKVAFLFSGQGSQWPGMAAELYEADPTFRARIDAAGTQLGLDLAARMFEPTAGPLTDTAEVQPALFVLEMALAGRLAAFGVTPDIVAGHSLGEWSAACVAGMLPFEAALDLVAARGALMGALPRGGEMAAVFAPLEQIAPLVETFGARLDIAALNAPEEVVVSGESEAIAALVADLDAQGIRSQRIATSHAFHSHLMDKAVAPFEDKVRGAALSVPHLPVVSNVTGDLSADLRDPAYWGRQIRQPVRFGAGLDTMAGEGVQVVVEIGPAATLVGFAQRAPGFEGRDTRFIPTMRRNRAANETLALALCRLFVAGVEVTWPAGAAARAHLPGYPFAGERHWIDAPSRHPVPVAPPTPMVTAAALASPRPAPNRDEIRAGIAASLRRSLQLSEAALAGDAGFFTLGVDSLALTEALSTLERRWKVAIPRRELFATLTTPRALLERVVREVEAKISDPASAPPSAFPISAALGAMTEARMSSPVLPPVAPDAAPAPSAEPMSPQAAGFIADFATRFSAAHGASRHQREAYGAVLADSRAVAGFRPETKALLYPIIGVKGQGSRVVDADGNDYVDLTMGFGVQLLGHNPPMVVEAIQRQIADQGLFLGPQAEKAGAAAAAIARLTGNERVLFCNTGTEAVMTALRLARHATGRSLVAMFAGSYHGHFDGTLARSGVDGASLPLASGTPPGMLADVVVLDYADPEGSQMALEALGERLAAVIVEPVQSRRPGLQPREFLQWLRGFTQRAGAALIFDEVLLGFRVASGGAQAWAGVRADLVTYGKIVGGGLPIGVVSGKSAFLDGIDGGVWPLEGAGGPKAERTFFAGTFNKNPLAMAAATAMLSHLEASGPALQERLNARTKALCRRLNTDLEEDGSPLRVEHFSSVLRFSGASDLFYSQLISRGVYVWEGRTCFLSTAHSEEDLDTVARAVRESARALATVGLMGGTSLPAAAAMARTLVTAPGQQALWTLAAFSPESAAAYNQSLVLRLPGWLDTPTLNKALADLVARHDSLRMRFAEGGGTAVIDPHAGVALEEAELADEAALAGWVREAAARPFDLARAGLLRAALLRLGDATALVLIQPHIVTDGWSMQVLANELGRLYSAHLVGTEALLPAPSAYEGFASFARAAADDSDAAAHWQAVFASPPPALALPADRPRPPLQTYDGATVRTLLPPAFATQLAARARALDCSLFTLCLAAYGQLLAELSGQDDLVVAIFAAGQPLVGEPGLTGYCISTVPLRLAGIGADALATARAAMAQAMAYPAYPLSAIVKASGVRRDPSRPPLASVSFNLDRVETLAAFAGRTPDIRANAHGSVRWDLNWNLESSEQGLVLEANFNTALFDAARVEGWIARYRALLEAIGTAPPQTAPVSAPLPSSLADRVAHWAERTPDAPAVIDREGTLSWAQLARASGDLAARLAAQGVGPGDRVAFCLARGAGPLVAMAAASHLGAAFVPLDPEHPAPYRATLLAESGARALVADATTDGEQAPLPVLGWNRHAEERSAPPRMACEASDLAYILFTSGSTGRPKGVRVSCGGLDAYARALLQRLALADPNAGAPVFGIATSFAADLGYTSVIGALACGGTLNVVDAAAARDPAAFIDWMGRHPADVLKIVPSHLAALMAHPDAAALLPRRALICGGDVLTFGLVRKLKALRPGLRIFNHYGPTETTIGCTMVEVTPALAAGPQAQASDRVPVGYALDGARIDIVDEHGAVLAAGETGEIRVSGAGVALGYLGQGDPEPAAAAGSGFSRLADGARAYLTGDLGTRDADGLIRFFGRKDDMVKVRGHRVDPNGVAAILRACPGVRDAMVLALREGDGPVRLVGAAVAPGESAQGLGAVLDERLPEAQRPSRLLLLEALPLTSNGKVDRAALRALFAAPQPRESAAAVPAAPTGAEGALATVLALWRELFAGRGAAVSIGPDDDFFALGGDSIMAIQLAGKARAAGWLVSPAQIFTAPTPQALAGVMQKVSARPVEEHGPVAAPVPLTPIQNWFMGIDMPDRRHWALTAVFELPAGTPAEALSVALSAAVQRHDGLRMRLLDGVPPAQQVENGAPPPALLQERVAVGQDVSPIEDRMADRLVALLDPMAGRPFAAGMIEAGAALRLVLAVHHLVFDMVSWAIIADDLARALSDPPQPVLAPPTAWSWWCLHQAGTGAAFEADRPYWQAVAQAPASVPLDYPEAPDVEGDAQTRDLRLEAALCQPLLADLTERFGHQPQESALALIARPLVDWTGGALQIELEGHGRQPGDAAIDLSRTLGWFTTRYPLALPGEASDLPGWLLAVKDLARAAAGRAMGYGLLRVADRSLTGARAQVSFNFLGDISRFGHAGLSLVRLGAGRERAAQAARPHRLAFNCWQEGGALIIRCEFGAGHAPATIERLLAAIRTEAESCRAVAAQSERRYSPGDFDALDLSQDDLDTLTQFS